MWRWRWAQGGESEPFESQEAAEAWLSGEWPLLLDQGIGEVELFRDDSVVYRMSLEEE
jgi:hypothetical protein